MFLLLIDLPPQNHLNLIRLGLEITRMENKATAKKRGTYCTIWVTERKIDLVLRVGLWTSMDIAG